MTNFSFVEKPNVMIFTYGHANGNCPEDARLQQESFSNRQLPKHKPFVTTLPVTDRGRHITSIPLIRKEKGAWAKDNK